jgi:hypothetical protein
MILLLHIIIALSSLVYTGYIFISPSKRGLYVSYALTALTIVTGSYLVVSKPAHMLQACTTGLIYLGVMLVGQAVVRHRIPNKQDVGGAHIY